MKFIILLETPRWLA